MTIINTIKTKMSDSLLLTIIYTLGHFVISFACVMYFTQTTPTIAAIDALVEPALNAVWLYALHKVYFHYKPKKTES